MSLDKDENEKLLEEISHGCTCGECNEHNCGEDHEHDCCGHEHDTVTLILGDNSELVCPIIDVFKIKEQGYIALLNPVDEKVLLYRFSDYDDDTISIQLIEDDEEFEQVTKKFRSMQE